jgi:hypothetical protein
MPLPDMLLVVRMFTTVGVTSLARDENPGRGTFPLAGDAASFQNGFASLTGFRPRVDAMKIPASAEHTATMIRMP